MSLHLSYEIKEYREAIPTAEQDDNEPQAEQFATFRDYLKLDEPNKGRVFVANLFKTVNGRNLWAFSSHNDIGAQRYLSATLFYQMAQLDVTADDLKRGFNKVTTFLTEGKTDEALQLSQSCETVISLTDTKTRWLNLSSCFLLFDDENPMFYDKRVNKEKISFLFSLDHKTQKDVVEWARDYFETGITDLLKRFPECFVSKDEDTEQGDFYDALKDLLVKEQQMNEFLNAVGNKSATERDRLLNYTITQLYNDMGVFIRVADKMEAEFKKGNEF